MFSDEFATFHAAAVLAAQRDPGGLTNSLNPVERFKAVLVEMKNQGMVGPDMAAKIEKLA